MLNKTTSPRIQKRGRGHPGSINSRRCWEEKGICYLEEPPKQPQFLWFLHQKDVGASPPSAAEDRKEQSVPMPSGTAKQRLRGEQQHTREMSTSSISLPLGTKALAKSLMAWTMLTSFRGGKKTDALGQICFKRSLKCWRRLPRLFCRRSQLPTACWAANRDPRSTKRRLL